MPAGTGNVDKIRDILFGSQMRDYETRFARLEETVAKETAEMRETNRRRFDQLVQRPAYKSILDDKEFLKNLEN